MRNIDEQLKAVEMRAAAMKSEKERKKALLGEAGLGALCLAIIAVMPLMLSGYEAKMQISGNNSFGTLIAFNPYLSYILIGVLAFILGISFTLLCLLISRRKGRRQ